MSRPAELADRHRRRCRPCDAVAMGPRIHSPEAAACVVKDGVLGPSRSRAATAILEAMHGTIVCGVTGAPEGRAAAQLAAAVANRLGLRLVLVHVVAAAGSHPTDAATEHEHLLEYDVVEAALDAIAL